MYSENVQELIEAAKQLLKVVEHINQATTEEIAEVWERLQKAVEIMELQEQGEICQN